MVMAAALPQILHTGLDLLADKDLIHQLIPTGGLGQFTNHPCRRFLYRETFRRGCHAWNQPQNGMEGKPLSGMLGGTMVRAHKHLWQQVASLSNLMQAANLAMRGKRCLAPGAGFFA